ncbi:MAG: SDR family NAD(P)-dependent oxidoreductase [Planctomycetota bacterium]
MKLKDRVAIVTGGGRNIGKAIAYRLHEQGCNVVVCARTQKEIDHTAGVIQEQGGRAIAVACDVAKESDVERVLEAARKFFGRIDFLINNAGNFVSKPLGDTTNEDFDQLVDGNLRGAFLFSRTALPDLRQAPSGRIVNVSSLFGLIPGKDVALYSAVKAGLIGFTKALARELHKDGINVNAVCPGAVDTDTEIELDETRPVLGRQLLPRDVADVVSYLVTNASSQITGAAIEIPGPTNFHVAEITRAGNA